MFEIFKNESSLNEQIKTEQQLKNINIYLKSEKNKLNV